MLGRRKRLYLSGSNPFDFTLVALRAIRPVCVAPEGTCAAPPASGQQRYPASCVAPEGMPSRARGRASPLTAVPGDADSGMAQPVRARGRTLSRGGLATQRSSLRANVQPSSCTFR